MPVISIMVNEGAKKGKLMSTAEEWKSTSEKLACFQFLDLYSFSGIHKTKVYRHLTENQLHNM